MRIRTAAALLMLVFAAMAACQQPVLDQQAQAFIEQHFAAAKQAEASQHFAKAIDEYQLILGKYPKLVAEVYHNLGLLYFALRRCQEAIPNFQQAVDLKPGLAAAHLLLGMSYLCVERPERALPELKSAHTLQPSAETATQLGFAFTALGKPDTATEYLKAALDQSAQKENVLFALGENYFRMAKLAAEDLISKNPDSRYDNIVIARIFDTQGYYQVAAKAYWNAARKDPDNASLLLRFARVLAVLRLRGPAEALLARYRQLLPAEQDVSLEGAVPARQSASAAVVNVDYVQEIRSLPPVDPTQAPPMPLLNSDVNQLLAQKLAADRTGKWKTVVEHFAARRLREAAAVLSSLPSQPGDWLAEYLLATAQFWREDYAAAEQVLGHPTLVQASVPAVKLLRWELMEHFGNEYLARLLEQFPNSARAHLVRARILDAQQKKQAEDEYKAAIAADTNQPGLRLRLADFYLEAARTAEALQLCRDELQLNPYSSSAKACIGRIDVEMRQPDQGIPYLEAAVKADPDDADTHSALGRGYELRDELERALQEYHKALNLNPSLNQLHYVIGRIYRQLGKAELAEQEFDLFQKTRMTERQEHVDFVQRYYGGRQSQDQRR